MITEANVVPHDCDTREPALITRAQQGDHEAFGELYAMHHEMLFAFVLRRVPFRQTAEDITSEVFVRAFNKLHTFTWQSKSIRSWLYTIARNAIADHCKRATTRHFTPVGDIWQASDERSIPEASPEELLLAQLEVELLHRALDGVLPNYRRVLELRFLQERSVPETANALGISEGATKTLQYRAMNALRKAYTKAVAA